MYHHDSHPVFEWLQYCNGSFYRPNYCAYHCANYTFDIEREYPWYRKLDFNQLYVHESITCQQDVVDEINALMQMSAADGYLRIHVSTNTPYVDPEIYSVIDYFEMTEVPTILYVKHECIDIEKLAELAKEPVVSRISILLPIHVVPE